MSQNVLSRRNSSPRRLQAGLKLVMLDDASMLRWTMPLSTEVAQCGRVADAVDRFKLTAPIPGASTDDEMN